MRIGELFRDCYDYDRQTDIVTRLVTEDQGTESEASDSRGWGQVRIGELFRGCYEPGPGSDVSRGHSRPGSGRVRAGARARG